MKHTFLTVLLAVSSLLAAIPQFGNPLYADHKSYSIGDIITVIISESSSASVSSKADTDKSFDHKVGSEVGGGVLDFIPLSSMSVTSAHTTKGDASTSREGKLSATMTARITDIDANGNLLIKGERKVEINGETQVSTIEGMVRPQDVQANNTVQSYNIAGAKISYSGKGVVNEGSRVGLISRVLNFLF